MSYFKHELALVESARIGDRTRIEAFAHVMPGATIGSDCNIGGHVFVENDVVIGDRVTVKAGVQIWDGIRLEDDVFVGPNATFTNDPAIRSVQPVRAATVVRRGASIGANATILPGHVIGQHAMVGAGAVVLHDVPPYAIVAGNPAHIRGYVEGGSDATAAPPAPAAASATRSSHVRGVKIIDRPLYEDLRGLLAFAQTNDGSLPFAPQRYFVVSGVPSRQYRGEHAHRALQQLLTCLHGECMLMVDDGVSREEISLQGPGRAVYLPPMVWGVQFNFSPDAVLLVLASDQYDAADYIRDYDEFLRLVGEER